MTPSVKMTSPPNAHPIRALLGTLDQAGRSIDRFLIRDSNLPKLGDLIHLNLNTPQFSSPETCSGLDDVHYQNISQWAPDMPNLKQIATTNKVPLPPEIMEHFAQMQCHCMMGLFPEIKRAWLTIDSDIYIWSYEHGTDLAYFDGLNEVIVSVGLVKPKPNVFIHGYVKYLLVLTTTVQVLVLGVRFSSTSPDGPLGQFETMHLLPDPIFVVPTEGVSVTTVACSDDGRLFLGGRDGSLFEIEYRAERSWFGKRFNKKNHSTGYLSYLVPSFLTSLAYGEEDPVKQIAVDNTRHILYTLSERGSIEVWDLGQAGDSISRVAATSQAHIAQAAYNIVKTLDPKSFRPLVYIAPLEIGDSSTLHLMAITRTGARLYFSTCLLNQRSVRPSTLHLRHVRMPPGYTAGSVLKPPSAVTMPLYSKGSVLLVTAPGGEKDELWNLSPDLMPTAPFLAETQSILHLDGKVWAVNEEPQPSPLSNIPSLEPPSELPPLVVRQHLESPRKFILLTAQGAQIVTKLRPVDLLRQIMTECRGPDAEAIRTLFSVVGEDQACATALVLACLEAGHSPQMSEWATRAFFLYGGEPRLAAAAARSAIVSPPPQNASYIQHGFQPGVSSTPRAHPASPPTPIAPISDQFVTDDIIFSAKHNGLYMYVSRILRPIWSAPIVVRLMAPDNVKLNSSVTSEDCIWILGHLHSVKSFLERNSQYSTALSSGLVGLGIKPASSQTPGAPGWTAPTVVERDAQAEEKASLCALKAFVAHSCEVLGLWKLLCEHQFHIIAEMLDKDIQNHLPNVQFKELLLSGHALNSLFINSLINSYLGDCASVDSISAKLREVCPTLYRNEDAVCSKANELLLAATKTDLLDEKEANLKASLNLCKEVAPQVDLPLICRQFAANQFYVGVLQLCMTCASKQDPQDVAVHWYKNNEPPEDVDGYSAYIKRMEIYQQLTLVLDQLYQQSVAAPGIPASPVVPSANTGSSLSPKDAETHTKRLLQQSLESKDELLHVAVLEWMLRRQLLGEIIAVDSPSVETFLAKAAARSPDAADLLWKYHERHDNHAAAAKLLQQLATAKGRTTNLSDRIGLLARAVMCMRSDRVGCAPQYGIFLQELEDQMAVAVIQQKVLDAVRCIQGRRPEVEAAIVRLNSELLSCTELYEQFAEPLQLWECKLAIIHSTNHNDPQLVEEIWQNIVASELRRHLTWSEKMAGLSAKVTSLVAEYGNSPRCFPLPYLVRTLEVVRCKGKCKESTFRCLLSAGVPYANLLSVYETLSSHVDRTWAVEGNEFHIIETIGELTAYFTENPSIVPTSSRKAMVTKSLDLLSRCLVMLYAKTGTQDLIATLKGVESKLKRLGGF